MKKKKKKKNQSRRELGRPRRRWGILLKLSLDMWDVGTCVSWSCPYDHGNGYSGSVQRREWLRRMN
jgi:hypothetical protein